MTQFTLVHLGARRIDNTKASQSFSRSARALRELNPRFFSELGLGPPGLKYRPWSFDSNYCVLGSKSGVCTRLRPHFWDPKCAKLVAIHFPNNCATDSPKNWEAYIGIFGVIAVLKNLLFGSKSFKIFQKIFPKFIKNPNFPKLRSGQIWPI